MSRGEGKRSVTIMKRIAKMNKKEVFFAIIYNFKVFVGGFDFSDFVLPVFSTQTL